MVALTDAAEARKVRQEARSAATSALSPGSCLGSMALVNIIAV